MELRHETPREGSSPALALVLAVPPRELPSGVGRFPFYLRVRTRFLLSIAAGLMWAGLSAWIAVGWTESLGRAVTLPVAVLIIGGIAIIPGYLNVQLVSSLILDRPRPIEFDQDYPDVTLLIAAYNEEDRIRETLEYALRQDYPGTLHVVVADDGSTDRTREVAAILGRVRWPAFRSGTTSWPLLRSSGNRRSSRGRWSPRARSACTAPMQCVPSGGGRTRSAKTLSSPGR